MEEKKQIIVRVLDFSTSPGPRYCNQGDASGEDFYHNVLNSVFSKALTQKQMVLIDLDGPDGYASSFLDEAFGNLVYDFGKDLVEKLISIKSEEEPEWIRMIETNTYPSWGKRRKEGKEPKKTASHEPWYRVCDNKLEEKVWISSSFGK